MILTLSGELFSNIRGQARQTDGERDLRFAWVDGSQKERGKRFLKGHLGRAAVVDGDILCRWGQIQGSVGLRWWDVLRQHCRGGY